MTQFIQVLVITALFVFSACANSSNNAISSRSPAGDGIVSGNSDDDQAPAPDDDTSLLADDTADDDLSDDDVSDDDIIDDDASDDDVSDDDTLPNSPNTVIRAPWNMLRYFSPDGEMAVSLDLYQFPVQAHLTLDGSDLPLRNVQWINVSDGAHSLEYNDGETRDEVTFQSESSRVTTYPAADGLLLPAVATLPSAAGASTPVRIRLENLGSSTADDVRLVTDGQPDFLDMQTLKESLLELTSGMTRQDQAVALMDFVNTWALESQPPSTLPGEVLVALPDFFTWSFGQCGEQAQTLARLAKLAGFSDAHEVDLTQHIVMEMKYDNAWHLFDPFAASYYLGEIGILSIAGIRGVNAPLIMNYTDQENKSAAGMVMDTYEAMYAVKEEDGGSPVGEATVGEGAGLALAPGDRIDLYPWGFGLAYCPACERTPVQMGTGVLTRVSDYPASGELFTLNEPFPFGAVLIEATTYSSGTLPIQATIVGSRQTVTQLVELKVQDGLTGSVEVSSDLNNDSIGIVREVQLKLQPTTVSVRQLRVQGFFQFNPRLIPQIDHDRRTINVLGNGDGISLEVSVHDPVDEISTIGFYSHPNDETQAGQTFLLNDAGGSQTQLGKISTSADGQKMVRLGALIGSGPGLTAAGHSVEVVSNQPAAVEIRRAIMQGAQYYEGVVTPWMGPDRITTLNNGLTAQFLARSRNRYNAGLGPVTFTLLIDGEARATNVVDFIAP